MRAAGVQGGQVGTLSHRSPRWAGSLEGEVGRGEHLGRALCVCVSGMPCSPGSGSGLPAAPGSHTMVSFVGAHRRGEAHGSCPGAHCA